MAAKKREANCCRECDAGAHRGPAAGRPELLKVEKKNKWNPYSTYRKTRMRRCAVLMQSRCVHSYPRDWLPSQQMQTAVPRLPRRPAPPSPPEQPRLVNCFPIKTGEPLTLTPNLCGAHNFTAFTKSKLKDAITSQNVLNLSGNSQNKTYRSDNIGLYAVQRIP